MTTISIELPDETASKLASLAAFRDTTPEDLLADMAKGLLADAESLEAWIAEGEADADAGRTVSFEEAMAEIEAIIAKAQAAHS